MKKFVFLLITFLLIFTVVGCGNSVEEKIAEKIIENSIENMDTDMNVNVSSNGGYISLEDDDVSINIEENQEWPDYVPDEIPKFINGEVFATSQIGESITLVINYEDKKFFDDYIKEYIDWKEIFKYDDIESNETTLTVDNGEYMVILIGSNTEVTIGIGPSSGDVTLFPSMGTTEIDFSVPESDIMPDSIPEFTFGIEMNMDKSRYPGAEWVKGYNEISEENIMYFLKECQNLGYEIDDSHSDQGGYIVTHSLDDNELTVLYESSFERVLIVYAKKQ